MTGVQTCALPISALHAFPGRLGSSTVPSTRWHGLELRHLRALVAIAETSSFSDAAGLLGYVQSTVSYNITSLERAVGTSLVRRRRGSSETALTAAGEELAAHARRILTEVSHAESALGPRGTTQLVVGLSADIARIVLPHLYTSGRSPEHAVQAVEASAADVRAMLLRGSCGLAVFEPTDDSRVASRVLTEDRYLFVQPLARRTACGPVCRSELATARIIVHSAREGRILQAFDRRGIALDVVLRADSDQSVLELVAAGLGSAVVPELAVRSALDRVHARPLDPSLEISPRVIAFGWERERQLLAEEIALIDDVSAAVSRAAGSQRPTRRAA